MADFKIDDDEIRKAVEKALFEHLTPERRDEFVKVAVQALCAPGPNRAFSPTASQLQEIFKMAVGNVAHEVALKEFETPENRTKIKGLLDEALEAVTEKGDRRDKLVANIADSISRSMFGRDY